jgi:hypothetical protein
MIIFRCPACRQEMEIEDRMAGKSVACVRCGGPVTLPTAAERRVAEEGLSTREWVLYTVLFACIPLVNVIASSVLYYVWRAKRPRRASQINRLGFVIFGCHIALGVLIYLATGY